MPHRFIPIGSGLCTASRLEQLDGLKRYQLVGPATATLYNIAILDQVGMDNTLTVNQTINPGASGGNTTTVNQTGMQNQAIVQQTAMP